MIKVFGKTKLVPHGKYLFLFILGDNPSVSGAFSTYWRMGTFIGGWDSLEEYELSLEEYEQAWPERQGEFAARDFGDTRTIAPHLTSSLLELFEK
jgi:hypothetical protein